MTREQLLYQLERLMEVMPYQHANMMRLQFTYMDDTRLQLMLKVMTEVYKLASLRNA